MGMPPTLPVDAQLRDIVDAVRRHRAGVIVAPPGAGKTTRIPPALLELGPVALLQPRRVAARALARRIADERGWQVGEDVGWQVRFENRASARTRLLVMTEGILTARLQRDPLLSEFAVVIIDEFHERSLHGDLALALARQAQEARDDLAIVVMSATIDPLPVAAFLHGSDGVAAPIINIATRTHPISIEHAAGLSVAEGVRRALARDGGHVLAFLPGHGEIRRAQEELSGVAADIWPLHGSLDAEAQDAALGASSRRKVILATNLAETSLTVEGVTDVVDSGLARVLRHDSARGLDRLEVERISRDSADQRAGRAGRTGPGRALRLWDEREILRPHREPDIERVDLAAPLLEVLAWGGRPREFAWFEAPPRERLDAALELLARLHAVDERGALTALGATLRRLPLPPRLARVLEASGGSARAAAACAILSERSPSRPADDAPTTESDVLSLVDRIGSAPGFVREAARELHASARRELGKRREADDDISLLRALLAGYPDRVARRREKGSPRLLLSNGSGAVLGRESGVREAEWLVAIDLVAPARGMAPMPGGRAQEARVSIASSIERDWIEPTAREIVHRLDPEGSVVRAFEERTLGALLLSTAEVAPDPVLAEPLLVQALRERGLGADNEATLRRLRFARLPFDLDEILVSACAGQLRIPRVNLISLLPHAVRRDLERLAPEALEVPSGRSLRLDYRAEGDVALEVKLQELFGLADSPCLGPDRAPILLILLSPGRQPVQQTRDLRSFWERTYPEVRRELRGQYPRHPWPEDPWSASPTHRTTPRKRP